MDLINRKIFVTGATGFIGRHVVEHLQSQGAKVTVLLRTLKNPLPDTRPALGDVSRYEQVSEFVARNDAVIHLAGLVGVGPCVDDIGGAVETNILGTLNVLAAMRFFNTPGVFAGVGNDRILDAGTGDAPTINQICKVVVDRTNSKVKVTHVPMRQGEPMQAVVRGDPETLRPLGIDAADLLGLEEGVHRTVAYYRENIDEF